MAFNAQRAAFRISLFGSAEATLRAGIAPLAAGPAFRSSSMAKPRQMSPPFPWTYSESTLTPVGSPDFNTGRQAFVKLSYLFRF